MRHSRNLASDSPGAGITVHVPLTFRRRGGRKRVVTPGGAPAWAPQPAHVDSTLVKAVARAHRWQAMLESGAYASIAELAAVERINPSYLARVLRLTLLAPEIVDQVINGQHPNGLAASAFFRPFPLEWQAQRRALLSR
jgi:hypothetical protein